MPVQLTTKTNAVWLEDSETISVVRRGAPNASGVPTQTTIYQGAGDLQFNSGQTYLDPLGAMGVVDAICLIDPASDGTLPQCLVNDVVQWTDSSGTNQEFTVIAVQPYAFVPAHLELLLKRGRIQYAGPK
jgi:hypothetical protein